MSMERRNDQYSGSNPESSYNFKGRSKSKTSRSSWMISDPEVKRKKRVATYKVFTVEGKVKATVRSSCRWLKAKYIELVRVSDDAPQPVDEMVRAVINEYKRPPGQHTESTESELVKAASLKEQKRLKGYRATLKIFSSPEARSRILEWVKQTQGPQSHHAN